MSIAYIAADGVYGAQKSEIICAFWGFIELKEVINHHNYY